VNLVINIFNILHQVLRKTKVKKVNKGLKQVAHEESHKILCFKFIKAQQQNNQIMSRHRKFHKKVNKNSSQVNFGRN
jgi:CRISPR/Cas system-associated endoribonuclease Cas2